ncbi:hypothetical protein PBRA_000427, partial [Plasmodiophora brassicae]
LISLVYVPDVVVVAHHRRHRAGRRRPPGKPADQLLATRRRPAPAPNQRGDSQHVARAKRLEGVRPVGLCVTRRTGTSPRLDKRNVAQLASDRRGRQPISANANLHVDQVGADRLVSPVTVCAGRPGGPAPGPRSDGALRRDRRRHRQRGPGDAVEDAYPSSRTPGWEGARTGQATGGRRTTTLAAVIHLHNRAMH